MDQREKQKVPYTITGYEQSDTWLSHAKPLVETFTTVQNVYSRPNEFSVRGDEIHLYSDQVIVNPVAESAPKASQMPTDRIDKLDVPGFALPGMPIKNIGNHSECFSLCQKEPKCHWVNYDNNNKHVG